MLEEAIDSDLRQLIANIACSEIHLMRVMLDIHRAIRDGRGDQDALKQQLDQVSLLLDNKRHIRQTYQKEYWGVPPDFNSKEENRRTYLGEWGCLFKHEMEINMMEMEIIEKACRMFADAESSRHREYARHIRDNHLAGLNISDSDLDRITRQVKTNLGTLSMQTSEVHP